MRKKEEKRSQDDMPADVSGLLGWRRARRVVDPLHAKIPVRRITINLDQDIIAIFKAEAAIGGPPYQVAINRALRSYLHDRQATSGEAAAELVLRALDDRKVKQKIRRIRSA